MKLILVLLASMLSSVAVAFAPPRRPTTNTAGMTSSVANTSTQQHMIGGFLQGLLGKTEAEITDTCYFDIEIDGEKTGRIEFGLYGEF